MFMQSAERTVFIQRNPPMTNKKRNKKLTQEDAYVAALALEQVLENLPIRARAFGSNKELIGQAYKTKGKLYKMMGTDNG